MHRSRSPVLHTLRTLHAVALAAALAACASTSATRSVSPFADADLGAVPAAWQTTETNGRDTPGVWRVKDIAGRRCVALTETGNRGRTYNLLLAPDRFPADLAIAVDLRADTGGEDQGGGIVWRAQDADNYYVARWNPLENNLRAYKVVAGKRSQLASVDIDVQSGWHHLEVSMRGTRIEVSMGSAVLRFADGTIAAGGQVGLWTKADAATAFADFRVTRWR